MPLHICHISVLNPSMHPRMFYKLARSQKKLGYQVSVCAQDENGRSYLQDGINIIPLKPFHRLSMQRLFFSFLHLGKIRSIRADAYVIHSPELLPLALFMKWRDKVKLIYDVHEDYAKTIRAAEHYPGRFGKFLASITRKLEKWAVKKVDAVSYAEEVYENILEVPDKRKFFLRNKFMAIRSAQKSNLDIPFDRYMLYTGTLAADWGVFRCLDLWEQLNQIEPLNFVMAGVSPHPEIVAQIREQVVNAGLSHRFCLFGGTRFVPYADIRSLIHNCFFGTALYAIKPYIRGKMPTKFYEYMAFDKALIFTPEEKWNTFNLEEKLGFSWKEGDDVRDLWRNLKEWNAMPPRHTNSSYSWEAEELELEKMLKTLH